MSMTPMICEKCGGKIKFNSVKGNYICDSCETEFVLTEANPDFVIVADKLMKYKGRSSHVRVPEGVRVISSRAFYNLCITDVILPSTLRYVDLSCFEHCPYIEKIVISEGPKVLDGSCGGPSHPKCRVETIEIPKSIEVIKNNPFQEFGVKKLIIHHELSYYFDEFYYQLCERRSNTNISDRPWECTSIETIITPEGVIDYPAYSKICKLRYYSAIRNTK